MKGARTTVDSHSKERSPQVFSSDPFYLFAERMHKDFNQASMQHRRFYHQTDDPKKQVQFLPIVQFVFNLGPRPALIVNIKIRFI